MRWRTVAGFAKTLPDAYYVLNASVPTECLDSWLEFMLSLKAMGVFKSIESVTLDWVRNVPMWAEHFNFETGTWEFDWTSKRVNPNAHEVPAMERSRYDSIDLAIIAQLQLDANSSVKQMASKSGVNYKTLWYHYRTHVLARGLIAGYIINWTGNRYDAKAEKILTKKHRYLFVNLIANGLSAGERAGLMEKVNRTPFVLLEGSSTKAYFAQMAFPSEEVTDALEFLQGVVGPIRSKVKWFHMDQSHQPPVLAATLELRREGAEVDVQQGRVGGQVRGAGPENKRRHDLGETGSVDVGPGARVDPLSRLRFRPRRPGGSGEHRASRAPGSRLRLPPFRVGSSHRASL